MDAARIQYLSQFIPDDSDYFRFSLNPGRDTSRHQKQIERFLVAYKDLAFGFHFVRSLIKAGKDLPPDVGERELSEFYWFETLGTPNQHLVQALSIHHPSSQFLENSLQAMLLTTAGLPEISKTSGIPEPVLKIYEQLFFNVRDRREEGLFIANVVYPEHRLVETMEGYIRDIDSGSFLKRSAYNNGLDDVAYFIGLNVDSVSAALSDNAQQMASRLESSIMANGYYLARNGFLNQRSAQGLASARSLLVAAKQGGEDTADLDTFGATSLGDSLVNELQQVKGGEMRRRISRQQDLLDNRPTDKDRQSYDDALKAET